MASWDAVAPVTELLLETLAEVHAMGAVLILVGIAIALGLLG